jgi:hypothetical protein
MNALSVVYLDVRIDRIDENNVYEDKSFEKLVYLKIDENDRDRKGRPSVISGHAELRIYYVTILTTTLWKHA